MGYRKTLIKAVGLCLMFLNVNHFSVAQTTGTDSLNLKLANAKTTFEKFDILYHKGFVTTPQSVRRGLYYYLLSYNIIKGTNDTNHICCVLIELGHNYQKIAHIDSALIYLNQGIFLANKAHLKRWEGIGLSDLGDLYYKANNPAKAEEYYNKAYVVIKESGNKYYLLNILLSRGTLKYSNNQYDEALKFFFEALPIVSTKNHVYTLVEVLIDIGGCYLGLKKGDEAKKYALMAYQLARTLNLNQTNTKATFFLGKSYLGLNQYDSAEYYLSQSAKYGRLAAMNYELCEIYNTFVGLYEARGDKTSTLEWYRKYIALRDSNLSKENADHIAELDQQYKSFEKEQTIALLNRDKALQKAKQEKTELEDEKRINALNSENKLQKVESSKKDLEKEQKINALRSEENLQKTELGRQRAVTTGIGMVALLLIVGGIIGYINFSKIRQLNNSLDKQKGDLTQINDVKDKLFAIISHDLRSPLANMEAMLMLLQKGKLSEEALSKHSGELWGTLQQNIQLMDNLLQWAVSQMKGIEVRKKEINIAELIEENIQLIQSVLDNKKITLTESTSSDLKVFADISMIRLVLRNLLSNAIKFTPEGGNISLKTEIKENSVYIEVADTGFGIDPKIKESLDHGHLRESTPGTKAEKGFGIGLMLCREFIECNGGKLFISSIPGQGSTFSFSLPLAA